MENQTRQRRHRSAKAISVFVIIFTLSVISGVLFVKYRQAASLPKDDNARIAAIAEQLQNTIMLPTDRPAIAHVVDVKKLTDPQLAAQAKNGDDLLVYAKSKRVILYRPSTKKVIDMFHITTKDVGEALQPQASGDTGVQATSAR